MNELMMNFDYSMYATKFIGIIPMIIQLIVMVAGIGWLKEKYKKTAGVLTAVSVLLLGGNMFLTFSGLLSEQVISEFGDKVYFGQVENGHANGWGRVFDEDRNILYIGEFKNNQYEGEGKLYAVEEDTVFLKYEGGFKENQYDGEGKEYIFSQGEHLLVYSGHHELDSKYGQGIYYKYNEENIQIETYEGAWAFGYYFGYGVQTLYEIKDDKPQESERYEGTFVYSKREGWGRRYLEDSLKYYGDWKDGKYEGKGTLYFSTDDGELRKYEGGFVNGMADGEGVLYDGQDNEIRKGKVKEGSFVDE